jgi:hypothetical protein
MSFCSIQEAWGDDFYSDPNSQSSQPDRGEHQGGERRLDREVDINDEHFSNYYSKGKGGSRRDRHHRKSRSQNQGPHNADINHGNVDMNNEFDPVSDNGMDNYEDFGDYDSEPEQQRGNRIDHNKDVQSNRLIEDAHDDTYRNAFSRGIAPLAQHQGKMREEVPEHIEIDNYNPIFENKTSGNGNNANGGKAHNLSFVLDKLSDIMEKLDNKMEIKESGNMNIQNMVLFILVGVFIIFILDLFFKIGKNLAKN